MATKNLSVISGAWIKKALPASSKGKLHEALHVPEGKKISQKKLAAGAKKGGKVAKEVALAKTLSKLRKK